jgi:excisionase family DNA binding protein
MSPLEGTEARTQKNLLLVGEIHRLQNSIPSKRIFWRTIAERGIFSGIAIVDAVGPGKFFSLSRQPKCIPNVATQSISSLKSTLPGESWRTLLRTFRTKVFLSLLDDCSAKTASSLCGREDGLKASYNLSESGHMRTSVFFSPERRFRIAPTLPRRGPIAPTDPEEIIRRIADFRSNEKSDPLYSARLTVGKAQGQLASGSSAAKREERTAVASQRGPEEFHPIDPVKGGLMLSATHFSTSISGKNEEGRPGGHSLRAETLLTVKEVAELLHVPVSWVYDRARKRSLDRLPAIRLGKYWRFREEDIVAWLRRHQP